MWLFECGWGTLKGDGGMESCGMKELVVIRLLLCVVLWCYNVKPQWFRHELMESCGMRELVVLELMCRSC